MSLDDVIKEAKRFGMNQGELDIVREEYRFHLNQYLDANVNERTSVHESYRRFQVGKDYAEGRARQYVRRCIDSWHKPSQPLCGHDDDKAVNDQ